jgi:lysophospholipase L1-like esterase
MKRVKTILNNILALLLGLTLALMTLEMLLRVFEPIQWRISGDKIVLTRSRQFVFDNHKIPKLDKLIYYSRNHLGFRGESCPRHFNQTLTILTVGGSTTECRFISDGKTWPDLLAGKLKQEFAPVWLNNVGLDGHSSFGHLVLLEDYLITLKPKVILFLVGANDRGLSYYGKLDLESLKNPKIIRNEPLVNTLAQHSYVINYALNFQKHYKAIKLDLVHDNIDFAHLKPLEVKNDRLNSILEEHRCHFLKPYAQRLQKLIDETREHGIEPVLITQPMVYGNVIDPVTGADLGKVDIGGINGECSWEIMELYNGVLKQVASHNQVMAIDLADAMPKNSRYFYDAYHFTNEGCQIVAEIIFKNLAPFLEKQFSQYLIKTQQVRNPSNGGKS